VFNTDRDALSRAGSFLEMFQGDNEILNINEIGDLVLSFVDQDRVGSADDFDVLQGMEIKLDNFANPAHRDCDQYIYNFVDGDNVANQRWIRGQLQPVSLSKLHPGSSQSDKNKLVKKWLGEQDSPSARIVGDEAQCMIKTQELKYGAARGPVFEGASNLRAGGTG
jgi:hypothetical protein